MLSLVARRASVAMATVFGASVFAFLLLRRLPGDPARLVAGDLASPETLRQIRLNMGLNDPLPVQYYRYLEQFFAGNWGFAFSVGEPVRKVVAQRLPATVELGLSAFLIAVVTSVSLALLAM